MRLASVVVLLAACGSRSPSPAAPPTETLTETETETELAGEPVLAVETEPAADAEPAAAASPEAAFLAAHNEYRQRHCAPPLRWSPELAKVAQRWANMLRDQGCAFEHSRNKYGENLAAGTSGALDPASTTAMWYREVDAYDFRKPGFSMATGHFTQLVWRGTTHLGCGMTTCKGLDIIVCNYDPPGNVARGYADNVKPTGCK